MIYETNRHESDSGEYLDSPRDWGTTSQAFRSIVAVLDHYLSQPSKYRKQLGADYIVTRIFRGIHTLSPQVARAYGEGFDRFLKAIEESRRGYTPFSVEEEGSDNPPL